MISATRLGAAVAVLAVGMTLGGCTQVWKNVSESLRLDRLTGGSQAQEREIRPEEIAAAGQLASFETAAGKADHPAMEHIRAIGAEVIGALTDAARSPEEKSRFFKEVLARDLDIPLIGRFALGRHWNEAADDQRQTYLRVFSAFLVKTYSDRLGGVAIDDFRVVDAEVMKDRDILVQSEVIQGREPPVRAIWRLRERDGRFRILDLTVEGISLAMLLRQEFASVLRSRGGVDGLIAMLREKSI